MTSGCGAGDPQTCPNFRLWQMAIPIQCYYTGRQIWTKDVWKLTILRTNALSPPNIFAPTPKITPKPHFGGPFNPKPIIQRALRHVNGATTLKLYGYIRLYLGCIEIFPLGDVWGRRATNVNLGTPDISEATTARKLNLKYHQIW